jgi:hypothetical protein
MPPFISVGKRKLMTHFGYTVYPKVSFSMWLMAAGIDDDQCPLAEKSNAGIPAYRVYGTSILNIFEKRLELVYTLQSQSGYHRGLKISINGPRDWS